MRTDVYHLPAAQQSELARVRQTLMDEFAVAISGATQPWKKNGRIHKIVLFGSYSRSDWVDAAANGYQSDFDILIVVSHKDLTDIAEYWYVAENKIQRDPAIGRPVNIIVHTLDEVNQGLSRGEYFWVDIARDGIAIYELSGSEFATPKPPTAAHAYEMASGYLAKWLPSIDRALSTASTQAGQGENDLGWRKDSAFTLHQAAERAYTCFLLVRTHYVPRSHNLKFLRSLAEEKEPRLIEAWPRATKLDRRRFELAKRAYVEARYSTSTRSIAKIWWRSQMRSVRFATSSRQCRKSGFRTCACWLSYNTPTTETGRPAQSCQRSLAPSAAVGGCAFRTPRPHKHGPRRRWQREARGRDRPERPIAPSNFSLGVGNVPIPDRYGPPCPLTAPFRRVLSQRCVN